MKISFLKKMHNRRFARSDAETDHHYRENVDQNASIAYIIQDYNQEKTFLIAKYKKGKLTAIFLNTCNELMALVALKQKLEHTEEAEATNQKKEEIKCVTKEIQELAKELALANEGGVTNLSLYEITLKRNKLEAQLSVLEKEFDVLVKQEKQAKNAIREEISKKEAECKALISQYVNSKNVIIYRLNKILQRYTDELMYYWLIYKKRRKTKSRELSFYQECMDRDVFIPNEKTLFPSEDKRINDLIDAAKVNTQAV